MMRPYQTEEELLDKELETLTRTSIVLVGAQSRPQGVVLRFEVLLETGTSLLRGEGRVVGFKEKAFGEASGLTLRFTRLDSRSKALVDKAAAIRDSRARAALDASMTSSSAPASRSRPPPSIRPPPANVPLDLTPPPASVAHTSKPPSAYPPGGFPAGAAAAARQARSAPPPPVVKSAPPPPVTAPVVQPPPVSEPILVASTGEIDAKSVERAKALAEGVGPRESVLERLRERRKSLSDARVTEILSLKRKA
ncbi:MAG: hypothetical protein ABI551_11550 [Polyangiaceae bacterium]